MDTKGFSEGEAFSEAFISPYKMLDFFLPWSRQLTHTQKVWPTAPQLRWPFWGILNFVAEIEIRLHRQSWSFLKFDINFDCQEKISGGKISFPKPPKALVEMLSKAKNSFLHLCFLGIRSEQNQFGLNSLPVPQTLSLRNEAHAAPSQASKWRVPGRSPLQEAPETRFSKRSALPLLPPQTAASSRG